MHRTHLSPLLDGNIAVDTKIGSSSGTRVVFFYNEAAPPLQDLLFIVKGLMEIYKQFPRPPQREGESSLRLIFRRD